MAVQASYYGVHMMYYGCGCCGVDVFEEEIPHPLVMLDTLQEKQKTCNELRVTHARVNLFGITKYMSVTYKDFFLYFCISFIFLYFYLFPI